MPSHVCDSIRDIPFLAREGCEARGTAEGPDPLAVKVAATHPRAHCRNRAPAPALRVRCITTLHGNINILHDFGSPFQQTSGSISFLPLQALRCNRRIERFRVVLSILTLNCLARHICDAVPKFIF